MRSSVRPVSVPTPALAPPHAAMATDARIAIALRTSDLQKKRPPVFRGPSYSLLGPGSRPGLVSTTQRPRRHGGHRAHADAHRARCHEAATVWSAQAMVNDAQAFSGRLHNYASGSSGSP